MTAPASIERQQVRTLRDSGADGGSARAAEPAAFESRAATLSPRLAAQALRLAAGTPEMARRTAADVADWEDLLLLAAFERLAPLAWARSSDAIAAHAPAAIVERWRRLHEHAVVDSLRQLRAMALVNEALAGARVAPVWLKGLPLAQRLYGDFAVRHSSDIDVFVPRAELGRAESVLESLGWTVRESLPSGERLWGHVSPSGDRVWLETHPALADWRMPHLRLPDPSASPVWVGGAVLLAHDPAGSAVHLALQVAKHRYVPLAWWLDAIESWNRLTGDERTAARMLAAAGGARRYLERVERHARHFAEMQAGADDAMRRFGFTGRGRRVFHPALLHLALADGWRARAVAASAWLLPRPAGASLAGALARLPWRVARHARALLPRMVRGGRRSAASEAGTDPGPASDVAGLRCDAEGIRAMLQLARETGAPVWVHASSASMAPSIPLGSEVRLVPVSSRELRAGMVVLVQVADGRLFLHRVVAVAAGAVRTRGDALREVDPPAAPERVLARADQVRVDGIARVLPDRRPWTPGRTLRRLLRRLRRGRRPAPRDA